MSTESLNRTSNIDVSVTQDNIKDFKSPSRRANMDVLRKRLLQEKKKEKKKVTIIVSTLVVSLGALTMLTY
tara:strand:- start:158 stop:370 length:213 start_codon:yes stop_codon:yes gene_type:complete